MYTSASSQNCSVTIRQSEISMADIEGKAVEEVTKEEPQEPAQAATQKKRASAPRKKAVAKKSAVQIVFVKSKRKSAVARASSRKGKGLIRINGFDLNIYEPIELRRVIAEPIGVSSTTKDIAKGLDITINVYGGGISSQAQAARSTIAKSIEKSSGSETVKKDYMRYDRFMLIDDARRVEPKKFKGPKARARFQKSYR